MGSLGIISDTHGLLRPEAVAALAGVDAIVHAGDVGSLDVLTALSAIAPVTAVRGNVDVEPWASVLPERASLMFEGVRIFVCHRLQDVLAADRTAHDVVVVGHSHKPVSAHDGGVLVVNPGSAGPRRFSLPITLALMTVVEGVPTVALRTLL